MTPTTETPATASAQPTVDELCDRLAARYPAESERFCTFARRFFSKSPRALLQERDLETLSALTLGAYRFLQRSRPQQVSVEVLNPEEEGWEAPVTLIRAEVGDRPFIVDSIREYLAAENLAIHHYVYPVLHVERDAAGEIVALDEPSAGPPLEALVHCEISRVTDAARCAEIRDEVERRLTDVVAATSDWQPMVQAVDETLARVQGYAARLPERAADFEEIENFLRWLRHDNFVFLGFREYRLEGDAADPTLRVAPGTGLGILRDELESRWAQGAPLSSVGEELRGRITGGPLLIISKTNREATVHRRARMDYVGVKVLDEQGRIVGERRFLGLFTSKAYSEHAQSIPMLRQKIDYALKASGAPPGSHDYKEIITIFNSMPKEELFSATAEELEKEVQTALAQIFINDVHVALRPDPLRRGVSAMVLLPRGKFSAEVRQKIQEMLARRTGGQVLNYYLALGANDQARLHFHLAAAPDTVARLAPEALAAEVRQIIRSWEERFAEALAEKHDAAEAQRLAHLYGAAFSEEYRAVTTPAAAVRDVAVLERMRHDDAAVAIELRAPDGQAPEGLADISLLQLYLKDERLVLSDFMPMLENAGVRVVEVNPAAVSGEGLPHLMLYSFAVQAPEGGPLPLERAAALSELLLAVRAGQTRNDAFNALVLKAGLRWREADVLRSYAHYAFQVGAVPTRDAAALALARYPEVARQLFAFFRARFDPALTGERAGAMAAARQQVATAMEPVTALADDRALRRLLALMEGTVRTNYYRHGGADPSFTSGGAPYLSFKVRSADVDELARSRLLYEVFVHSAHMEAIHLRGAPVSRGGIRWSDRPDDFRTEVMGLVQTQVVKNAVIVPSGSKGGFITRRLHADRDRMMAEAADQYRTLMRGLLDITDNIVDGQVVPPQGVVRHDGDDPYLVVAADKGTAHLSDVANSISAEYGFWLGDAFASGGSHGYDHKEEGITARGAWECVKRHFREMGKDIQAEPFTVVGIGDMSGDVFGNGMLLSEQIRLLAAFDHRHIFLDPDPDPATSFAERRRMFALPRSSWEEYDRSKLSVGGMIVPRGAKAVELTPEARRALGLPEATGTLDGEALIRAVLKAPAELLWNGGIGTYVKDRDETHADAGDPSNNAVRINADELRCRVVGEGGNLGFTQRARIAFALRGGRLNTDALDNSGGVDMSDHEVNLKILLGGKVAAGEMGFEERNTLLESMTEEVSRLVLKNNLNQSLAVSLDEQRSRETLNDFSALITTLEREKLLNRVAAGIPDAEAIADRAREGIGLTRPTLCVLLAHAKLQSKAALLASPLLDDEAAAGYLRGYFPPQAVAAAGEARLEGHRLRREIIATEMTSDLVDLMGSSFLHRVARDSGRPLAEVARAWMIASQIAGAQEIRADLQALEGRFSTEVIYRWLFALARVLESTTHWALVNVSPELPATRAVTELRAGLAQLRGEFGEIVTGEDRVLFLSRVQELEGLGVEPLLAQRIITLRFLPQLLNILRLTEGSGDPVQTARAYYLVSERFGIARLRQALWAAAGEGVWEKRYAQALADDVDRAQRRVARAVLACRTDTQEMAHCLDDFTRGHAREVEGYLALLDELATADNAPLPAYALAARALQEVAAER